MSEINVTRDSKLIKVLASQARNERLDSNVVDEASQIINDLVTDLSPANRHQIAQTMAFTVDELQKHELDFLNVVADIKNIGYGDKAVFDVKTGGIKAFVQAKGSTTARSYVADRQVTLDTDEISARPAINVMDLRAKKVNMADLIREANREITRKKIMKSVNVLTGAIDDYSTPFYAAGSGIVKPTLDAMINYFRRLGPVSILGDIAAVGQLSGLTGMAMNAGSDVFTQHSDRMIDEYNENGMIGKYNGCGVIALMNGYEDNTTTPILPVDKLFILPAGIAPAARNLKLVNEGGVNAIENQDINDMVFEVRLDQAFGAGFVSAKLPTIGMYQIN